MPTFLGSYFTTMQSKKNSDGKVYKLKKAIRNLGGKKTQCNGAGTWVRGMIVAEHHNQVVDAILLLEEFIGINESPDPDTLDYRIRRIDAENCPDDYGCANVVVTYKQLCLRKLPQKIQQSYQE